MKRTVQMARAGIPKSKPGAPIPHKKVGSKGGIRLVDAPAYAGLPAIMRGMFKRLDWNPLNSYIERQQREKKARAARLLKAAA
jgi:hypothetical protein